MASETCIVYCPFRYMTVLSVVRGEATLSCVGLEMAYLHALVVAAEMAMQGRSRG